MPKFRVGRVGTSKVSSRVARLPIDICEFLGVKLEGSDDVDYFFNGQDIIVRKAKMAALPKTNPHNYPTEPIPA